MKNNILDKIRFLGFIFVLCFANFTMAQQNKIEVTATITDMQGNPLNGVKVLAPKGVGTTTDVKGTFILKKVDGNGVVVIEKEGYDTQIINLLELQQNIKLVKSEFLASDKDVINQGLRSATKREMTGSYSSVNSSDRIIYDNTQWVKDYIGGLMVGVKGSSSIRGIGSALFVIDGVIGRNPDILNMDEVDQITVLKDANAIALYGSQAQNGVIIINTKRGATNKRSATVNIRSGIRTPISFPNYLGAVDYMELYNEARNNDGLTPLYDATLIDEYKNSTNPYQYPDVDFYSDAGNLRGAVISTDIISQFTGGNDNTKYYVNLGWNYDQSLVMLNPDANKGSNRFNVRGNIDFKVNKWINSSIDVVAIINSNKSANTNILNSATSFKPNSYAPLLPISYFDTTNDDLNAKLEAANIFNGFLLGGSQVNRDDTPIADVIGGGYRQSVFRSTQFNNSIDFDLNKITKGLSAKTYLSFDFYDAYTVSIDNKYSVYEPTWQDGKIIDITQFGDIDQKDLTENVRTTDFTSRLGFYALLNYKTTIKQNHSINTTLVGYVNSEQQEGVLQPNSNAHVGFQFSYAFKKKLFADFSGSYVNSTKLAEGNRGGFSPTLGLGYILSEENFMKKLDFVNYLKLKASGGIIKSDLGINGYYLYDVSYQDGSTFTWADGKNNREKDISQGQNLNLGFEDRIDFNVGLESYLFNSLWFEFNYFKTDIDNQLTRLNAIYPSYYNIYRPYDNYDKDSYHGFELGLDYSKKFKNGISVSLGANILYSQSEVKKRDEAVEFDYLSRIGKSRNAIFGLVDNGFYSQSDFTSSPSGTLVLNNDLPVPSFGAVQPGDIKYIDQNNDGIIDNNDNKEIGQFSNPWSYGVNLKFNYKGISLFVLGVGEFGGDQISDEDYYWVDGDDKYSEVVIGRWTPDTANSATYPRLSSNSNNNNFRRSTFWMYDNSYFSIKRAQLTYEFESDLYEKLGMSQFSINTAVSNLVEFGENTEIRQLKIGSNPLYRTISFGLRATF